MKKLVVMLAMVLAVVAANAATVKWGAANLYQSDGTSKFSGIVTLYCVQDSGFTATASAVNGTVTTLTSDGLSDSLKGTYADFYIAFTDDAGKTFTSAYINKAVPTNTNPAAATFGNMTSQTQDTSKWSGGGGDVPEPTSGLLLLVGGALLALRRKQK